MTLDVALPLTDREAYLVHHAISTAVTLLDSVDALPAEAPLAAPARDELLVVARRLDHERRHKGTILNPNAPLT